MTPPHPKRNETSPITRTIRWNAPSCLPVIGMLIFGLVACAGFYRELSPIALARESRKWPTVEGHIVEVNALYFPGQQSKREGFYPAGYRYHILYTYAVTGKPYRNNRLRFTSDQDIFRDESSAHALIADFKPGATVRVHYDSDNPAISTLTHDFRLSFAGLGYCLFFTVLTGLWIAGVYLTARENSKPDDSGYR